MGNVRNHFTVVIGFDFTERIPLRQLLPQIMLDHIPLLINLWKIMRMKV